MNGKSPPGGGLGVEGCFGRVVDTKVIDCKAVSGRPRDVISKF